MFSIAHYICYTACLHLIYLIFLFIFFIAQFLLYTLPISLVITQHCTLHLAIYCCQMFHNNLLLQNNHLEELKKKQTKQKHFLSIQNQILFFCVFFMQLFNRNLALNSVFKVDYLILAKSNDENARMLYNNNPYIWRQHYSLWYIVLNFISTHAHRLKIVPVLYHWWPDYEKMFLV